MSSQPIQLGKYELLEKIGEGGFGVVYRGRDTLLDRPVAIKVLKTDLSNSPDFVERFRREARLAASLRHPSIVNVLDVGEQEGHFFLVMDLLTGGTLHDLLKDGQPLPPRRALELLTPVAEALDYAHSKNMLHRDVKPSNILLDEKGRPVLTDFGLGKVLNLEDTSTTGLALGTVQYMAPEQILGKAPSPATDLYALGIIAYQMLTGQVPFGGATPFTIQKGHAEEKPPDARQLNPALGEQVAQALAKALEKDPALRYESAAGLVKALSQAVGQEAARYAEQLYRQARALMEKRDFAGTLVKWELLRQTIPDYRDSLEQENQARKQLKLAERYASLVQKAEDLKVEAKSILADDENYPDESGIFKMLGFQLITDKPEKSPPTKSHNTAVDRKRSYTEILDEQNHHTGKASVFAGVIFVIAGVIFAFVGFSNRDYGIIGVLGIILASLGIWLFNNTMSDE